MNQALYGCDKQSLLPACFDEYNQVQFFIRINIIGNWICTGAFSILAFSFQMGDKSWDACILFAFIGIDDDLADPHESAWHNR